jgi:DNA-binding NarL/FixJ family response regulator
MQLTEAKEEQLRRISSFLQGLSQKRRQVLRAAVKGLSDQEIAEHLCSSRRALRHHIRHIDEKAEIFFGRKLKFRQHLVPMIAPYFFIIDD